MLTFVQPAGSGKAADLDDAGVSGRIRRLASALDKISTGRLHVRIKAAVARAHGVPLSLEGVDLEGPRPGELVVRLVAAGVAQVDIDAISGSLAMALPFVPGSQAAGIVEHVGEGVVDFAAGDAVVIVHAFCGACANCAAGRPLACLHFAALNLGGVRDDGSTPLTQDDGSGGIYGLFYGQSSFATHVVCRARSAVKVTMGAPLELFACLGGEMLMGAGAVMRNFAMGEGDTLVITGADAVGLIACMVAKARGVATIVVADPRLTGRNLALECGASIAVHTDDDLATVVRSVVADGARFAIDTTGHAGAITACFDSLRPGGGCALLHPTIGLPTDLQGQGSEGETILVGSDVDVVPASLIPALAALHARGKLPLDRLVSFFPFELVNDALNALAGGAAVKPVLRFPIGSFGDIDRAASEGAEPEEPEATPADDLPEREAPTLVPVTA